MQALWVRVDDACALYGDTGLKDKRHKDPHLADVSQISARSWSVLD